MKIVQIVPYSMNRPGGVQSNVRDLSAWLRSQGHEVRIVAPNDGSMTQPEIKTLGNVRNVSIHGTRFELSLARRSELTACVSELREWGAQVAHLHTPWTPMLVWQVWRALGVPAIATFHATVPTSTRFDPVSWALRKSTGYFNKRLKKIIVPSEAPQDQWKNFGANPVPLILPPTIDLSTWRQAARSQKKSQSFSAIYIGRLEERKGIRVLLEAWKLVQQKRPDIQLTIAGSGPEDQMLHNMVRNNHIRGVAFHSPPDNACAREMVAKANLLIAPALHGESFGLVLVEAMAAGTLPVAAANSGFSTVLSGMGQNLLVPPGEAEPLANKILELAESKSMRAQMCKWAQTESHRFDVRTVGPKYEALLQAALN
ncbi:glycosyltransferase family 4 protein [Pseudopelagicola sp. nBUS_19]|uniref:glycosyltransferase family 4 protein n=1 Tax=Pseudopelagicola sp. nBUS_19 TaxID=3395316 RepID=UPI003EBFE433